MPTAAELSGARNVSQAGTGGGALDSRPRGWAGSLLGFLWQPPQLFTAKLGAEGGAARKETGAQRGLGLEVPETAALLGGQHTPCHGGLRRAHWRAGWA